MKASLPGMFKKFAFDEIDMGQVPARVVGIKTYSGEGPFPFAEYFTGPITKCVNAGIL